MDMFVANLREALQSGIVPDISLFHQLENVYDKRHYDFYPEVIIMASTVYRDMVNRYLSFSREAHRMPDNQIAPMDLLARDTHRQALAMADAAKTASRNKVQANTVRLDNSIKFLRDQVIQYKGNPGTLSMPFTVMPRIAPGDVASFHNQSTDAQKVESIAREQLARAGDRLGSGSQRSNQWLQLIREYRQSILNREAVFKSFNPPSDYLLDTVSN
jgi:hypothetical protein